MRIGSIRTCKLQCLRKHGTHLLKLSCLLSDLLVLRLQHCSRELHLLSYSRCNGQLHIRNLKGFLWCRLRGCSHLVELRSKRGHSPDWWLMACSSRSCPLPWVYSAWN